MSATVYLHPVIACNPQLVRQWERKTGCTAIVVGTKVELRKVQSGFGFFSTRKPWRLL